jgi:hypothetical protein
MHVEKIKQSYMDKYFLDAAREKGYPIKDVNGYQTEGILWAVLSFDHWSSSFC